jgi:hypothetical protein
MNKDHAKDILEALAEWFDSSDAGPNAGSLLFADDLTLSEHINAALGGIPNKNEADARYNKPARKIATL